MKLYSLVVISTLSLFCLVALSGSAIAQCAGCDSDYNKQERAELEKQAEIERIEQNDPPLKDDPLGNALVGGAVTGAMTGSVSAAATDVATSTAIDATVDAATQSNEDE